MKRFVYRFEVALRAATLEARTAASAVARARAALAACEPDVRAAAGGRFDPARAAPGGPRDLEMLSERAIRSARALVDRAARARGELASARAAFDRAEVRRSVFERHCERMRARALAAAIAREERERDDLEDVRRMR